MKCLVCGKEFNGNVCPVCDFPIVEIPGDYEEGMRTLQPVIDHHRKAFAERIALGVVTYEYEMEESVITEKGNKNSMFGNMSELLGKTKWLDEFFECPNLRNVMYLSVVVSVDGKDGKIFKVKLPNFKEACRVSLGICCDEDLKFCLKIKNEKGEELCSEKTPVIR